MWLINCRTFLLEEFLSNREVRYAILSHTWEKGEEVDFSEFRNREATGKSGWRKIEKTCQLALNVGCEFAWVDTCCIDKRSSAELTEAINSMFGWYAGSEICYTYLADHNASDPTANLSKSRWFTRGWTLQELIAPGRVHFYDNSWSLIGTKDVLSQQLSLITGIGHEVLLASQDRHLEDILDQLPIARKMSWAAKRETTRIEDTAYCLLGIFGVNLPLLYGEGDRAFIRLQEEVLKTKNDLSLLAWRSPKDKAPNNLDRYCGVFAQHPRDFHASGKLSLINDIKFIPDFTMTNKGIKILTHPQFDYGYNLPLLQLNCYDSAKPRMVLSIYLMHQGASVYARAKPHLLAGVYDKKHKRNTEKSYFFLSKSISPSTANSLHRVNRSSFRVTEIMKNKLWTAKPESLWDSDREVFITDGLRDFVGVHEYQFDSFGYKISSDFEFFPDYNREPLLVAFGFGYGFAPWACITHSVWDLQGTMEREDWALIAQTANCEENPHIYSHKTGRRLYFGNYTRRVKPWIAFLTVTLEEMVDRGEIVYVVQIHCGEEPERL